VNQDQIVEWAKEAGFPLIAAMKAFGLEGLTDGELRQLEAIARFAALVADHAAKQEREACALVCEAEKMQEFAGTRLPHNAAIKDCAAAIRARGEKP